jgi:hypothetical protein
MCFQTLKKQYKHRFYSIFWAFSEKISEFVCKISDLCLYLHQKCGSGQELRPEIPALAGVESVK